MNEYLLLMHAGAPPEAGDPTHTWPAYFARLRAAHAFEGGSAIGGGVCVSKAGREAEARHRWEAGAQVVMSQLVGHGQADPKVVEVAERAKVGTP